MLQFSEFVWALSYSLWDVLNSFLFIDATDRSKISGDQKRFFIALSLYPLSFFANTPFKSEHWRVGKTGFGFGPYYSPCQKERESCFSFMKFFMCLNGNLCISKFWRKCMCLLLYLETVKGNFCMFTGLYDETIKKWLLFRNVIF